MNPLGTLGELAARTGGRVVGDASTPIERVAAVDEAGPGALTFAVDERYLRGALASKAAAVLTEDALLADGERYAKPILAVPSARVALAALLSALEPPRPQGPFVHPSAAVHESARIGEAVWIGPHVAIGPRARIGDRTVLLPGVVIGTDAVVGGDCLFHPRAYLADRCTAGDRVVLQAGAVIGSDGFGWAFLDGRLVKIPQVGTVTLGDDVEIGANTCVDRAQTGVTSIGEGTKIDNLCQIGHNARIGKHNAIAAFAGMAGTTTIGDYNRIAGSALFPGHTTIGSRVTIGGASHVWGDVPDGAFVTGQPAQNHRDHVRLQAYMRKLPKLFARVDALEKRDPGLELTVQYQTTLRDAIGFEGAGLHTGAPASVRVLPAPAGSGLRFRVNGAVEFPARADYVVDTVRATVLGSGGHTVSTVEHLLSALLGCGVDNALIDVDGPEIPVEDGSAKVFADAIAAAGLTVLREARVRWIPTETRLFHDGDKLLIVAPASSFRVRMTVDYAAPIGTQYVEAEISPDTYRAEVAPNRTFGFLHEVEALVKRGLAQGGTLENAVVFGPDGPLAPLRSPTEPARHKILDLVGDFALLGAYPQCEVIAIKSGHKLHCTAVRELRPHGGGESAVSATS